MRRRLLLVVLAGLVVAACADGDDEPTAVSTTTAVASAAAPTSTAAESSADPFAIPDVIDAAYVNRVLAELYRINGDLVRKILAANTATPEDLEPLRAIYNDPQFEIKARGILRVLGEDKSSFRLPPGDRRVVVETLIEASPNCILAAAISDFSAVVVEPPTRTPGERDLFTLRPTQPNADPRMVNSTGWSIGNEEVIMAEQPINDRAKCGN